MRSALAQGILTLLNQLSVRYLEGINTCRGGFHLRRCNLFSKYMFVSVTTFYFFPFACVNGNLFKFL